MNKDLIALFIIPLNISYASQDVLRGILFANEIAADTDPRINDKRNSSKLNNNNRSLKFEIRSAANCRDNKVIKIGLPTTTTTYNGRISIE